MSLWDYNDYYCEMWVEKIDLKSLFSDICKRYTIPLINIRGRTCLNSRAGTMKRFLERENEGKTCVLLYCGDHDPSGLDISGSVISDIESLSGASGYFPDDLIVDRFGLNFEFIQAEGLSWSDNLVTSSGEDLASPNHPDHLKPYVQDYLARFGARKVEANALVVRPEAGRRRCLEAVRRYSPTGCWPISRRAAPKRKSRQGRKYSNYWRRHDRRLHRHHRLHFDQRRQRAPRMMKVGGPPRPPHWLRLAWRDRRRVRDDGRRRSTSQSPP